ncbi:hypothetical protein PG994_004826 [Apiospora phragmitis]|uniref:Uncharacterized protein n=1 Tax=Apiospora phragmitis TaxID=2905665 RepID=A0ABR1VSW8_9PEZI
MERGNETGRSSNEESPAEAETCENTNSHNDMANEKLGADKKNASSPQDPVLQEAQRQLALSLASLIQNVVEKETKELLKQIRDNSERQITLLKASLAESWRDAGQTAQLRAALVSEEPWKASDESLVSIEAGAIHYKQTGCARWYLEACCEYFESEKESDEMAMLIILAVWGFGHQIIDDPSSLDADLGVLTTALLRAQHTEYVDQYQRFVMNSHSITPQADKERLRQFFHVMWQLPDFLRCRNLMNIKLRHGNNFILLKHPFSDGEYHHFHKGLYEMEERYVQTMNPNVKTKYESQQDVYRQPYNSKAAALMAHEWQRTRPTHEDYFFLRTRDPEPYDKTRAIFLHDLQLQDFPSFSKPYGLLEKCKAPSAKMGETLMPLTDMVKIIAHTALCAPAGLEPLTTEVALSFLFSFVGPWKAADWPCSYSRYRNVIWEVPAPVLVDGPREHNTETALHSSDLRNATTDSLQLEDILDSGMKALLMFETNLSSRFETSDRYFFIIELLRISTEWIKDTENGLRQLQADMDKCMEEDDVRWLSVPWLQPRSGYTRESRIACTDVIKHNWWVVLQAYEKYEKNILAKIERKTQEVKSLRDGLFNATSVREATKGTHINEYILVSTVMTIVYLPLGFVATLYGIDMFDFEMPGQTTTFAVTTALVSLATYLAIWGLLYGVRRRRKKGSYGDLLPDLGNQVRPAVQKAKAMFRGGDDDSKQEVTGKPEVETKIDEEPPPEAAKDAEGQGRNEDNPSEKPSSRWSAVRDWATRKRRRQEAGVLVGVEAA